jgi:hypothetical protein
MGAVQSMVPIPLFSVTHSDSLPKDVDAALLSSVALVVVMSTWLEAGKCKEHPNDHCSEQSLTYSEDEINDRVHIQSTSCPRVEGVSNPRVVDRASDWIDL